MLKKFGSKSPSVWTNFAHFLHVTIAKPDRARSLLPRAIQSLGTHQQLSLMTKFASLEFRSPDGDAERGRTMFEGLLTTWPKKFDLWNQLLDLEIAVTGSNQDEAVVRDVFERGAKVKGLKPRQAEKWFRRWAEWEEKWDPKGREKVMARAQEWAAKAKERKAATAEAEGDGGQ